MEVALGVAVPVGLVRWSDPVGCYSLVVKLTFELGAAGAVLAGVQSPLSSGTASIDGLVLEPSDFVEAKSRCDVIVSASTAGAEAVRVRVGPLDGLMSPATGSSGADANCSPPRQRMPFPAFPLDLEIGFGGRTLQAVLPGPSPAAALLDANGARTSITLCADTLVIHAAQALVCVSLRGTFHHAGDIDGGALLVVADGDRLAGASPEEIRRWPRQEVGEQRKRSPARTIRLPRATVVMRSSDVVPVPTPLSQGFDDSALTPQPTMFMDLPLDLESDSLPTLELIANSSAGVPPSPLTPQSTIEAIGFDASAVLPFGIQPVAAAAVAAAPAPPPAPRVDRTMPVLVADLDAYLAMTYGHALPFADRSPSSQPAPDSKRPLMVVGGTPLAYPPVPFSTGPQSSTGGREITAPTMAAQPALPPVSAPISAPAAPVARSAPAVTRAPALASYQRSAFAAHVVQDAERSVAGGAAATSPSGRDARRIEGLSLEEYTTLRAEIWSGLRPKQEVFREHGLTALQWRRVDRAWRKQIDAVAQDADQAALLIASMRSSAQ